MADKPAHRLQVVAEEADHCTRCDLYRDATQTVFGEGPVPPSAILRMQEPDRSEALDAMVEDLRLATAALPG